MTLDDLAREAVRVYYVTAHTVGSGAMRAAVLAVLDEVKRAVPELNTGADKDFKLGWNLCRDEMLRRLDEMAK